MSGSLGVYVGTCHFDNTLLSSSLHTQTFPTLSTTSDHFFPLKVHTSKESPLGWGFLVIKHIIGFIPAYSSSSLFRNFLIFYDAAARICGAKH